MAQDARSFLVETYRRHIQEWTAVVTTVIKEQLTIEDNGIDTTNDHVAELQALILQLDMAMTKLERGSS
jgi:hypothetical protein